MYLLVVVGCKQPPEPPVTSGLTRNWDGVSYVYWGDTVSYTCPSGQVLSTDSNLDELTLKCPDQPDVIGEYEPFTWPTCVPAGIILRNF